MGTLTRRSLTSKFLLGMFAAATICGLAAGNALAATYYWDSNGWTGGAGDMPAGSWGTSSFWTTSLAGTTATTLAISTSADILNFVASPGTNSGENPYTVTVVGSQNANSVVFASWGAPTLSGTGTINLWGGGITVSQYAYGTTAQGAVTFSSPIVLKASQTWTNNASNPLTISGSVVSGSNSLTLAGMGNTTILGNMSGAGSLVKIGAGTLTLSGSGVCNGLSVNGGAVTVASTGSLATGSNGALYVGNTVPAAMTIQDNATVVTSELDVNFQNTAATPSTLTITGGSLNVTGATYIGRAQMQTGPSTTSGAIYQSGGTAILDGAVSVACNGTATSLYNISGGGLNVGGGLTIGGNNGGEGNGVMNVLGSAVVSVSGGSGLVIGQDTTRATSGSLDVSGGTLAVAGNVTLGSPNGNLSLGCQGIGSLTRTGGAMTVSGGLVVDGNATVLLDDTSQSVATSFGGGLVRNGLGTLVLVPEHGDLNGGESLSVATNPAPSGKIIGPWAVCQVSASNSAGDYLTSLATSGSYRLVATTYSGTNLQTATPSSVVNVTAITSLTQKVSVSAVKFGPCVTTISGSGQLSIGSGGLIINGGTVAGGTVSIPSGVTPLIYAGSATPGQISSALASTQGLVAFGPGCLVLAGSNSNLHGEILIGSGTLVASSSLALGPGGSESWVSVATGASLGIEGNTTISNVPITLNGTGGGSSGSGSGALVSLQNNNSISAAVNLGSNSVIAVTSGSLTLAGPLQGNYTLTKSGSGLLILSGSSSNQFPLMVTMAEGTLRVTNATALGPAGTFGVAVNAGTTLQLQGGIAISAVPLTLSGVGTSGNGAMESLQGSNSAAGPVTLASNSQVNVDSGTLALSGPISGGYALTVAGTGALVLSGTNSFTEALNVLGGTLSVPAMNAAGGVGPLGAGTAPVTLGSNGSSATLLFTGTGASTNRAFTLAAGTMGGGGGVLAVAGNVTLSGVINGNGGLTMAGSGTVTLSGSNLYTGATTVTAGTLAIASGGSINASSDLFIGQGGVLQVTAGTGGNQLPDAGNVTLSGGMLGYAANGSYSPAEAVGALVLNPGQSQIVLSNAGSGTPYLCFASGTPHTTGATVGFSSSGGQVQFLANPPALSNGILPYAFVGAANSATVDFATLSTSGSVSVVSALTYSGSTAGNLALMTPGTYGSLNVAATGSQSALTYAYGFNSLKLVGPTAVTMTGSGSLSLVSGGLICTGSSSTINGSAIWAEDGELVVDTAANLNISSLLSATALTKTGTATLTLSNPYPIAGNTFINQGTLNYALAGNMSYGGVISGAGNLLMSGTGAVLTLGGSDTYSGSTTVTAGTLCVNGALAGGGPVTVLSGAILSGSGSIAGNVSINNGTLTIGQQGTGGSLHIGGGLSIGGGGSLAASGTAAGISGNLNYTSSASSTFSGTIVDPASTVTLDSPPTATLTLSGSNQYGGGTFLQGGTLRTSNSAALGNGVLTMTAGTLDLDGSMAPDIVPLALTGGVITNSASGTRAVLTVSSTSTTSIPFSTTVADGNGQVAIVDSAAGTLVLSGSNSYTGGTTVTEGTLLITAAQDFPAETSLTVGAGGTFIFDPKATATAENISAVEESPVTTVPEPGTIVLLLVALWSAAACRRFSIRRPKRTRLRYVLESGDSKGDEWGGRAKPNAGPSILAVFGPEDQHTPGTF